MHVKRGRSRADTSNSSVDPVATAARVGEHAGGAVQCRFSGDGPAQETAVERGAATNHTGMPNRLKTGLERLSGFDLSPVRVHYNSSKPEQVGALAYAQGTDIHLAQGQERHLPHEGWHVVQQMQGRVRPTTQYKGVDINVDRGLEREADVMGEKAFRSGSKGSRFNGFSMPLKTSNIGRPDNAPVQGKFGFEIEVPILFLHKRSFDVPVNGVGNVRMNNVPCDAGMRIGETDVYDAHGQGAECHVNVDHFGPLNPLYKRELEVYAANNGLSNDERTGLIANRDQMIPHGASILEVVTDAWDESTLTRNQARQKFRDIRDWVIGLFGQIQGSQQAALGNYFIGSTAQRSDLFQQRLGYFHATYGVKLSQVPRLFERTTRRKDSLRNYARRNPTERSHANSLLRTYASISAAKTALNAIKRVWPRNNAGWFKGGNIHTKGTKGWNPGTEDAFLGFLTLVDNYLLMFQLHGQGNLAKQQVGMHYYKSDLYDLARQLPAEIINTLTANAGLRRQVITAIGASVGLVANDDLGGPMEGWTLKQYLDQLFRRKYGTQGLDVNNARIRDPLLADSINPYSAKLGPEQVGPALNRGLGVIVENRHLEYMYRDYGARATQAFDELYDESARYTNDNTALGKDMFDSIGARQVGPARRPVNEWVDIMLSIYDMIVDINRR